MKRRRALESTPSRNSQPETHPKDGQGRRLSSRRSDDSDRFPNAFPNSSRKAVAKRHPLDLAGWRKKFRSRIVYRPRSQSRSKVDTSGFLLDGSFGVISFRGRFAVFGFPHRCASQLDTVGVVNQAIQDAVGNGRIADLIVPMRDRHLAGQHSRTNGITVVTDFQKVPSFAVGQWSHAQSSTTKTSIREKRSSNLPKLPSARATARSRNRRGARI